MLERKIESIFVYLSKEEKSFKAFIFFFQSLNNSLSCAKMFNTNQSSFNPKAQSQECLNSFAYYFSAYQQPQQQRSNLVSAFAMPIYSQFASSMPLQSSNPPSTLRVKSPVVYNSYKSHSYNAATGNIFEKRADWSILSKLPLSKQNEIHIRVKDEGPYGNDEIRCFVLAHLSSLKVKQLDCMLCACELVVYDRFPLVDGTLFVSPFKYDSKKAIPTKIANKNQYLYGVCLKCLSSQANHVVKCKMCDQQWNGSSLQIGTLYKFDIIAAFPCCQPRLNCKRCDRPIVSVSTANDKYFSSFSEDVQCPHCHVTDGHFLKPLETIFKRAA